MPKRIHVLTIGLGALLLSACGSTDAAPAAQDPAATTPPAATEPTRPVIDKCSDKTGDGGPVDLKAVSVTLDEDLTVVFDVDKNLPSVDTVMLGINVSSTDGEQSRQLAAKWIDGKASGPFVFDMGSAEQQNLGAANLSVVGAKIIMTFPDDAVSDLGDGWQWSAFSTAAGENEDACPGNTGSFENQTFPH